MPTRVRTLGFWTWMGIIFVLVVLLAYYQGFTADVKAIGPFAIQAGELAQGRNPQTGAFSGYPQRGATG